MQSLIATYTELVVMGIEAGVLIPDRGQFSCINQQRCSECLIVNPDSEDNECMCSSLISDNGLAMSEFERKHITPHLALTHPEYLI